MNIHEHQAKEILKEFGAPVSKGIFILSADKNRAKNPKIMISKEAQFFFH